MHRRRFLSLGAVTAVGALAARRVAAQVQPGASGTPVPPPPPPATTPDAAPADGVPRGVYKLHLADPAPDPDSDDPVREGVLYIPKSYDPDKPMPLVVMLHGFAGSGERMKYLWPLAEELG